MLVMQQSTTRDVLTNVAVRYIHRFPNTPDNKAGANERAGFIDAPEMNAKKKMSSPTIPPITNPPKPFSHFVYTAINITAISKAESNISTANISDSG